MRRQHVKGTAARRRQDTSSLCCEHLRRITLHSSQPAACSILVQSAAGPEAAVGSPSAPFTSPDCHLQPAQEGSPDSCRLGLQGDQGDLFYIIKEGEAVVYQSTPQGTRKVNHLFKADFFGERALLVDEPRSGRLLGSSCNQVIVEGRGQAAAAPWCRPHQDANL